MSDYKVSNEVLFAEMKRLKKQKVSDEENYARNKLITDNYDLVKFIVNKYFSFNEDLDELIAIGTIGLISAVDNFDENKRITFSSFASDVIKNEINKHFQINNYQKRIIRKYTISLETPVNNEREGRQLTLEGTIPDEESDKFPDIIAQKDEINYLYQQLKHLTPDEQFVLVLRFGLYDNKSKTLEEVSQILSKSKEIVRIHEKNAIGKLRTIFNKEDKAKELLKHQYPIIKNYKDYVYFTKEENILKTYTSIFNKPLLTLEEIRDCLIYLTPMEQFALCSTYSIYDQNITRFDNSVISREILNKNLNIARKKLFVFAKSKIKKKYFYNKEAEKLKEYKYQLIKSQDEMLIYLNIEKLVNK